MKRFGLVLGLILVALCLFSAPALASTVEGTVTVQGTSTPLAGAWVRAYYVFGLEAGMTPNDYETFEFVEALADASGNYLLDVPLDTLYIVVAGAPSYITEFYNGASQASSAFIGTSDVTPVGNVNFTLAPCGWISGRVTNQAGTPLSGISVYVEQGGQLVAQVVTGPTGTYATSGIAPGNYTVRASGQGTAYLGKFYNNGALVSVVSGAVTPNINIALELGGSITGIVVDSLGRPVTGATVGAQIMPSGTPYFTTTNADGSYSFVGLEGGNYIVGADQFDPFNLDPNNSIPWLVRTYYFNAYTVEQALPVGVMQGVATSGIDLVMDRMGTISGTVTDTVGQPVAGVTVQANGLDVIVVREAVTDANGAYSVEGLQTGNYLVFFSDGAHLPQYYSGQADSANATPVSVVFTADTPNINAVLSPMGSISGTVVEDGTGSPISGAFVSAYDAGSGFEIRSAITVTDGTYQVTGLATGSYKISVEHDVYVTEFYIDASDITAAAEIPVTLGNVSPGINMSLAKKPSLSGRVTTAAAAPIAGAVVVAMPISPGFAVQAETDQNGDYTITGIQPGSYMVSAGNATYARKFYNNIYDEADATPVVVGALENRTGIDFTLELGGSISGQVTYPNTDMRIQWGMVSVVMPSTGAAVATIELAPDGDGSYTLSGLPAGTYKVYAEILTDVGMLFRGYYGHTKIIAAATSVALTAGLTTGNINFELLETTFIDGRVYDDFGQPLANVVVSALSSGPTLTTVSAADGYYYFQDPPAREYKLYFDASSTPYRSQYFQNAYTIADAMPLWPSPMGSFADVYLQKLGSISGTVRDSGNNPLSGIWVRVDSGQDQAAAQTDANGAYSITRLVQAGYRVRVDAVGTPYVGSWYPNTYTLSEAQPVDSSLDRTDVDFNLVLGGGIGGTVVSAETGSVLGGVTIGVYDVSRGKPTLLSSATTSADGSYQVSGVLPGSHLVMAEAPDQMLVRQVYQGSMDPLDLTAVTVVSGNTTTSIDFSLQQGGAVAGKVYDPNSAPLANARVRAMLADGTEAASTITNADGTYQLNGVPAGSANYIVVHADNTPYVGQFYGGELFRGNSIPVTVASTTVTTGIDFGLQMGGTIFGNVFAGAMPITDARIELRRAGDNRWLKGSAIQPAITDPASGAWSVAVPIGTYEVLAEARSINGTFYEHQFYSGWFSPVSASPVTIYGQGDGANVWFSLMDSAGTIRGTTTYAGAKTGKVIITTSPYESFLDPELIDFTGSVKRKLGSYELVAGDGLQYGYPDIRVRAFIDVNGNDRYDAGEPHGEYTGNNGVVNISSQAASEGVDIVLQDPEYTVTLNNNYAMTIDPMTNTVVKYGETATYSITALGYANVQGCGGSLSGTTYVTAPITADCQIEVNQSAVPSLLLNVGVGGQVSANFGGHFCYGGQQCMILLLDPTLFTFTPIADPGYTFSGWSGACTGIGACSLPMDASRSVTALFTRNTYTVTPVAAVGGSLRPATPQIVEHGNSRSFVMIPEPGYSLNAVNTDCPGMWTGGLLFIAEQVTNDCSVTPVFAAIPYEVTAVVVKGNDTGGTIIPEGLVSATYGDQLTFDVTVNPGYHVLMTGCSGTLNGSIYTTGPITGNCTITASFFNAAPTAPVLVSPADALETTDRTPTLAALATDEDGDALQYTFEVSFEPNFTQNCDFLPNCDPNIELIVARGTVAPQPDGSGQWTVPDTMILRDNTLYYWRVYAEDGASRSANMSTASFFVNTGNDAPLRPTVSEPANSVQVASATPVLKVFKAGDIDHDALSYEFELSLSSTLQSGAFATVADSGSMIPALGETLISWTTSTLAENTIYYWHSRAVDEHGLAGPWSQVAGFYVNANNQAPGVPVLSAPADNAEQSIQTPVLTVANSIDPEGSTITYVFEADRVNTFDSASKQESGLVVEGAGTTSWSPTTLADNTLWYWRVKANDGAADSSWMSTTTIFVNTANDAPGTPTVNYPSDRVWVTTLTPQLSVNAATDIDRDALTYEYEIYGDRDLFSLVMSAIDKGTSWTVDSQLSDNTWYYWRARARDEHGLAGAWSAPTVFFVNNTGYNDPPTIAILSPTAYETVVTNEPLTIRWSDSDPDDNAVITLGYDTLGSGCTGTTIQANISENDSGNSSTWDTTGLLPGTYHIYAQIDDGHNPPVCVYVPGPVSSTVSGGDVDGDGKTDIFDVLKALRLATGLETPTLTSQARADVAPLVNGVSIPDGNVTLEDVLVILRKAAGLW